MLGETSALQVYRVERASLAEGVRGGGRVGGGYHMWRWHGLEAAPPPHCYIAALLPHSINARSSHAPFSI